MGRRTPFLHINADGTPTGSFMLSGSALLTILNTIVILGFVGGIIATGVLVGNARNDVNTLRIQTSNVTEFTPQTVSYVDTPARFNETSVELYTAVVKTFGYCVTLTNSSSCILMGNVNASYTPGPAPAPGTLLSFRVSNIIPAAFIIPDVAAIPPLQVAGILIDSLTNATVPFLMAITFVDIGTDMFVQMQLPAGLQDNTIANNVIAWSSQFNLNYIAPK